MKKLLTIALLLIAVVSQAQFEKYIKPNNSYGVIYNRVYTPNSFTPALDTLADAPDGSLAFKNHIFWIKDTTWKIIVGGGISYINATIPTGAISITGGPITSSGTFSFHWLGDSTQYVRGNGSLGTFSTDVQAVGNPIYAPTLHSHIFNDITDGTAAVRNLFSAGSGLSYNSSTGVFTWTGSGSGITSLNGLTGTTQTLAIDTTADAFSWSSVGTQHTLKIPARIMNPPSGGGTTLSGTGYVKMSGTTPSYNATIPNADLTNSSITIAGNSTALGGSVTQDQITGLSSTGLIKRTGANTLAIATAGTDYVASEADPIWSAASSNYYTKTNLQTSGQAAVHWGNITNAPSFLTSYTETDPIYSASAAAGITSTNITSWNSKMSNPMTAAGDLIIGGASGVPTRLAAGTNGYTLTMQSGSPIWVNGNTWSGTIANSSTSAATSQTLFTGNQAYVFTGSSAAIWTLPDRAGSSNKTVWIKNQGTAPLTIQRAGTDEIFTTTNVTSETLQPGESRIYLSAGSYWQSNFISIGSGTVNSASQYNWAYYAGAGTAVSGISVPANKIVATDANGLPTASSVDLTTFNNYFYKNEYFTNRGNLDTVMTNVNDSTIGFKSIRVTAGTGITVTPTITDSTINYQVANSITNNNQLTNGSGFITNATGLISAGTNVTITGSGTSGSPYVINASGSGGSSTFAGLTDVAITSPANNQVPTYNSGTGKWTNTNAAVMNLTSLANGDLLHYVSANNDWENFTPNYLTSNQSITLTPSGDISGSATGTTSLTPAYTVTGIKGNTVPTLASGYLHWNGSAFVWDTPAGGSGASTFSGLTDVNFTSLANNQVAMYNSTSTKWENKNAAVMNTTSLTDGQLLKYVSANNDWENTSLKTINGNSLFGSGDITVSGSLPSLAQNHFYVGNSSGAPVDAGTGFVFNPSTNANTVDVGTGAKDAGYATLGLHDANGSNTSRYFIRAWLDGDITHSFFKVDQSGNGYFAGGIISDASVSATIPGFSTAVLTGNSVGTTIAQDFHLQANNTDGIVLNGTTQAVTLPSLNDATGVTKMVTVNNGVLGYQAIPSGGGMVYPSAGIPVSTGSAWGTSITDNSANWNTAYNKNTVSGSYSSGTLTLTKQDATTVTVSGFPTNNNQLTNGSGFISAANLSLGTATSTTLPITNSAGTGFTLPTFSTTAGLVPGTTSNTTNFLRADGTWAAPAGGTTYTFSNSLRNTSGTIDLQGDVTTPNPNAVYGADASGSRGWQPLRSVNTTASTTTLTPNIARMWDMEIVTAQAAAITIANPTGTISNGYELMIRIADNGTARAITWGTNYRASTNLSLPTTTTTGRTMYIKFIGNSDSGKMDLVSVLDGF